MLDKYVLNEHITNKRKEQETKGTVEGNHRQGKGHREINVEEWKKNWAWSI